MSLAVGATGPTTLGFTDTSGNPQPAPTGDGSGLVVTFSVDDTSIATVGAAVARTDASGNTNYSAPVLGVSAGTYNMSATVANVSGTALLDDDGVTAFIQPSSVAGTITPAAVEQATTAVITVP